jgi:hypothetical protein
VLEREKDYLLRQIRRLMEIVLAIVGKAGAGGEPEAQLEAIRRAADSGLGLDYRLLRRLDPASVPMLVADGDTLRTLAWLAAKEAEVHALAGDPAAAKALRLRAVALYAECALRFPAQEDACRLAARALLVDEPPANLGDRYVRWLRSDGGE